MKRFFSGLFALVLVVAIGLTGCSGGESANGVTGNYGQDTLALIDSLRTAVNLPDDAPDKQEAQAAAKEKINAFASRYRRDGKVSSLASFTTMRTALNSLAAHYSSYPNRPLPEKLKKRLEQEFRQVEVALKRGS
ncbi:MAG: photosystem II protein Psb27 [Cyanobacteria bacterium P01_F01_bin.153]